MSDPIGRLSGSGLGSIGGTDSLKKYVVDIGKGDTKGTSFSDTLTKAINQVSDAQDNSADLTTKFLAGEPVELHQVMAASEEAGIAVEMMIELRNKFTDAYKSLVNMQG